MRKQLFRAIVSVFLAVIAGAPAFAQFPQKQYWASDYGQWQIPSQQANTYLFSPPGVCNFTPPASGNIIPFNTNAPVFIVDATPANSELVTPSAVTNTGSQCGVTVTPVNNHYSFSLISGTAGLQEALNAIPSTVAYAVEVDLDRIWYAKVSQLTPSSQTPQSIIAAATGNASAYLVDKTTTPFTFYHWTGSKYVAGGAPSTFPFNSSVSSYTQIAAPTALTTATATNGMLTTATTGGTIPASSTYRLGITYVDASGQETALSTDSASTATIATGSGTATNTITISAPATATGAVGYRVYMSAASGASLSEILYSPTCTLAGTAAQSVLPNATVCAISSNATVTAIITGTATVPAAGGAYVRAGGSSGSYPPFAALGAVSAAATGTLATVNIPAGYLNSLGKSITLCGNGNATTNSTPGTLTLATTLSSLPGTTTITPFSLVSGTTTASAQVPFDFCETWTTSATGATGTLEVHGWIDYVLNPVSAGTASPVADIIYVASSTIDLTKQDEIAITIKPTTTALTAAQLRQLVITAAN